MVAAGVTQDVIEEMQDKTTVEDVCEIWEENWGAALFFLNRCGTCWKVGMNGGFIGLDRCEIEAVMRMTRVKNREAMLDDLQIMESTALKVFREKEEK